MGMEQLEKVEDFKHGDIIRVISYEENCGIEKGDFKAIVIESKKNGLIIVPENFEAHLLSAVEKGADWETEVDWLLGNNVEVFLLHRFDQLINERWEKISKG